MGTYLPSILARENVNTAVGSPALAALARLSPHIQTWAGTQLISMRPSGSFAKGTANVSGTDVDLFISLKEDTVEGLEVIYESLFTRMSSLGFGPTRQDVSINVKVDGRSVDLVPGKRQNALTSDHSLWRRRAGSWTKTNIDKHIQTVRLSGRANEVRLLKLWRNQRGLEFPSFYLELSTIAALKGTVLLTLEDRVLYVLDHLRDRFEVARIEDPANAANVLSDDLSQSEKRAIAQAARVSRQATNWNQIVV